jgi:ABC-type Fe3+-hydroxamate transport system substrate-binding protein
MPLFTDQLGRSVESSSLPQRIVSLVPSQTELLYSLELDQRVVGITKFCVHPSSWFRSKTRVGGTKALKAGIIHQLRPDLIIANKEENVEEQVNELARHYPVWISDINDLPGALDLINRIGELTGTQVKATSLIDQITTAFETLKVQSTFAQTSQQKPRAAYLIWRNPYMTAGGDTFIHDMLTRCGFLNIFENASRYPEITTDQLKAANCQVLILSSEPFPFTQQHIAELQPYLPNTKIILADGEFFSWYGSRLLLAPAYFNRLLQEIS